jgi:FkbM family methyltransferase
MQLNAYSQRLQSILAHPANRRHSLRALTRSVGWMFRSRVLKQPDTIRPFPGVTMRRYPDSHGAKELSYYGNYPSYDAMKLVEALFREGDAFLDLGANIGIFTCLVAPLVGASGRVDSFEASPTTFLRLAENAALNDWPQVHLYQKALGAAAGEVTFTMGGDTVNHVTSGGNAGASTQSVSLCCLDEVLAERAYTLAKLDVEGYELPCLQGARRLLERQNPPLWLVEINGALHRYGFREEDLFTLLHGYGYRLGVYSAIERRLSTTAKLWDDVVAFSAQGESLLRERLPGVSII